MTRFGLDAATLVHVVRHDVPVHPDHRLVAPATIRSDAMTLLLRAVRDGELTDAEALELHERITELKMRVLGDRVSRRRAWTIARERSWDSTREADYLAVTLLQADVLVTVDGDMRSRADGLVPVADVDALTAP